MIRIARTAYRGWSDVWVLENEVVTLKVLASVGPRILHFGFVGAENEFYEDPADAGQTGGSAFRAYGGHRLWVAPENERTTLPDNDPVEVATCSDSAVFTAPPDSSGLQKQIQVQLAPVDVHVRVAHRITNRGSTSTQLAPWALSVLRPGGRVILPLPPRAPHGPDHLLPQCSLAVWSYTDLGAPCWTFGAKHIYFDQRRVADRSFGMQKLGMRNPERWGAYLRKGTLFIKSVAWRDAEYPDFGCNFETFANREFIELETLGSVVNLAPGETCEHIEHWSLAGNVLEGAGDDWADTAVLPHVRAHLQLSRREMS